MSIDYSMVLWPRNKLFPLGCSWVQDLVLTVSDIWGGSGNLRSWDLTRKSRSLRMGPRDILSLSSPCQSLCFPSTMRWGISSVTHSHDIPSMIASHHGFDPPWNCSSWYFGHSYAEVTNIQESKFYRVKYHTAGVERMDNFHMYQYKWISQRPSVVP